MKNIFYILILITLGCASCSKQLTTEKPNILFFLVDDQRFDALGCYGHPILQTPNIDKLANEGIRFTKAYVTTSICMASRATIFTGLTARTNGVSSYVTQMDTVYEDLTYPVIMRENGYRTGFIGKFGFKIKGKENAEHWFDYFKPLDRDPYFKKMEDGSLRHETELDGDYAIEFLRSQDKNQPFCLSVSFNSAHAEDKDLRPGIGHFPWPKAVDGMYDSIEMPAPTLADSSIFRNMPEFLRNSMNRHRYYWRWNTPEKYQTNMRAYFRMISGIDNVIGRVLDELKALGLDENTVIVYAADNGYYMADRGFAGKWSHFEESLHIPMIIYDPRVPESKKGNISDELVLNLDIPSTFLDLADIEVPKIYQGKSLKPIMEGEDVNLRENIFCEHLHPNKTIPKWEGVHTGNEIYARYFEQEPVYEFLHDMNSDPRQLENLATNSAYEALLRSLQTTCDSFINEYVSARLH